MIMKRQIHTIHVNKTSVNIYKLTNRKKKKICNQKINIMFGFPNGLCNLLTLLVAGIPNVECKRKTHLIRRRLRRSENSFTYQIRTTLDKSQSKTKTHASTNPNLWRSWQRLSFAHQKYWRNRDLCGILWLSWALSKIRDISPIQLGVTLHICLALVFNSSFVIATCLSWTVAIIANT